MGLRRFVVTGACILAASLPVGSHALAADPLVIEILHIQQQPERAPQLSDLVVWPEDEGVQGARLGIEDNATTGRFLKHDYTLREIETEPGGDVVAQAREALSGGARLAILNVPGEAAASIAALPEAKDDLLFNAGSADDAMRDGACSANLLHTLPSRAMLSDALVQFLAKKQWDSIFLIEGNRPNDRLYGAALRRSISKFRLSLDHEKQWIDDSDLRRNAAQEVPVFTQARDYDVVIVADEDKDFAQYVMYNTWLPRPVAGSAGIEPEAWGAAVEQWGAIQMQNRFTELAGRAMMPRDYASWAAVRTIGEAVTRTKTADPAALRAFILSDDFSLAGFKGAKMTYRNWNGQLRQPIPLLHPQAVVALAPIEGFLHQRTELDTLGLDEPESQCTAFRN